MDATPDNPNPDPNERRSNLMSREIATEIHDCVNACMPDDILPDRVHDGGTKGYLAAS
jgi:hypothetical protein